jgi:hypothetical protein
MYLVYISYLLASVELWTRNVFHGVTCTEHVSWNVALRPTGGYIYDLFDYAAYLLNQLKFNIRNFKISAIVGLFLTLVENDGLRYGE